MPTVEALGTLLSPWCHAKSETLRTQVQLDAIEVISQDTQADGGVELLRTTVGDSAGMAAEIPHGIAVAMFWMMVVYFVLLVIRLLLRRDWATIVLVVALLAPVFALGPQGQGVSVFAFSVLLIGAAVFVTTFAVVVMRIGLIAAIVFLFVLKLLGSTPLTFEMSEFYAPQSILGMLLVLAIAAYGVRYSIAGQSVFRDVLGDGPGARGIAR